MRCVAVKQPLSIQRAAVNGLVRVAPRVNVGIPFFCFFFFFFLISAVRQMSAETCDSSDCIHPACLGTALRRFIGERRRHGAGGGLTEGGGALVERAAEARKSSIKNRGGDTKGEMNDTHSHLSICIFLPTAPKIKHLL